MRTLHFGLRVADLDRSLAFYTAVGYEVVGRVPETPLGELTMFKLPDDEFVTIELVHDPSGGDGDGGTGGLSHFVIKVESMDATIAELSARGIDADGAHVTGRLRRLPNDVDRRPRRQPDRVGPVAGRSRRRHDRGRLVHLTVSRLLPRHRGVERHADRRVAIDGRTEELTAAGVVLGVAAVEQHLPVPVLDLRAVRAGSGAESA